MSRGIALKVLSAFAFMLMSVIIRRLGGDVPVGQVLFSRQFFGLAPIFIWLTWNSEIRAAFTTDNLGGHLVRALVGFCAMICSFSALARLPLSDATFINYGAPLVAVALAAIILKERVRIYRWSAVGVGMFGVGVILWPQLSSGALAGALAGNAGTTTAIGTLFALAAIGFNAAVVIQIRRLTQTETTASIVMIFTLSGVALGLLTLPLGWVMPSFEQAALLVAMGILGGVGQMLMTEAFRHADASLIAPFEYTTIIYALILGYLFFGEVPDAYVLIGGAIVVAAGIYLILRERQLGIQRARDREAAAPTP